MYLPQIFEKRYSCRKYTDEQITDEDLEYILQAGNTAPIGMNRKDDYKILVIQNTELLQEIEDVTHEYYIASGLNKVAIFHAPTLIMVAVNETEHSEIPEILRKGYFTGLYCTSACILENMILAATEKGLGNIFLTGLTNALNHNEKMHERLHLPSGYRFAAAVAIGHTDLAPRIKDLTKPCFETEFFC